MIFVLWVLVVEGFKRPSTPAAPSRIKAKGHANPIPVDASAQAKRACKLAAWPTTDGMDGSALDFIGDTK